MASTDKDELFNWVLFTGRRRWRFAAYFGQPPGSHRGIWITRVAMSTEQIMRGINLRVGFPRKRPRWPCFIIFLHFRDKRPGDP